MAELIDFLFLFWFLVAGGTYVIGSIYENYLKERQKLEAKRRRRLESQSRVDDWTPSSSSYNHTTDTTSTAYRSTSQYNSSHQQYNNSNNYDNAAPSSNHQYTYTNPYSIDSTSRTDQSRSNERSQSNSFGQQQQQTIRQTDFGHYDAGSPRTDFGPSFLARESQAQYQSEPAAGVAPTDRSIPTATGFNSDCVDWVNRILFLFYSQPQKYGPIIAENIYRSLNEKLSNILSSSVEFSDWIIEFRSIDLNRSTKPELKNVRTENESDKSVSAVCKIYNQRLVCDLKLNRARLGSAKATAAIRAGLLQQDAGEDELHYELSLENLEGKLKSVAMLSDKLIVVQFMEKPDTKILLRQINQNNQRAMSPPNEDSLVRLILQSLTQVVVDLYFGDDPEFPQFVKQHHHHHQQPSGYRNKLNQLKGSANEIKRQIKHDFLGALSFSGDNKERKIFVKLLRAKDINYNQDVTCILELDQPKQHAISSTKRGSNPFWDEHFLFLINEKSSPSDRLTVELWDSLDSNLIKAAKQQLQDNANKQQQQQQQQTNKSVGQKSFNKSELTASGKFLGLAHLSIDELRRNPVQKQTLALQSRSAGSNEQPRGHQANLIGRGMDLSDSIGGELQLELMFLEHSNQQQQQSIRRSTSAHSISSLGGGADQGDVVSVDRKLTPSGYLITTTTIAKPAPSGKQRPSSRDRLSPSGAANRYSPVSTTATEQSAMLDGMSSLDGISTQISQRSGDDQRPAADDDDDDAAARTDSRASRSRSRSRGFLRAIRRRFSFSRSRRSRSASESAGGGAYARSESASALQPRSSNMDAISIDSRSRASSEISLSGRAKSMPASRDSNEVPTIVINKSRLSDASSAFNFAQPKSQLVIECSEPKLSDAGGSSSSSKDRTLLRHYAIPDDPASERRWRRRGLKLHVFNEHQFVACHLAGSSTCHLCGRVFSRRPGKQGYKCRNCHLLSHKQCHVKVDHNCPYATKDGLKLEYIDADPPASLVFEKAAAGSQQQQQKPNRPISRSMVKSISVEVDDR